MTEPFFVRWCYECQQYYDGSGPITSKCKPLGRALGEPERWEMAVLELLASLLRKE